jgi:PAS domain S-box-containing protein
MQATYSTHDPIRLQAIVSAIPDQILRIRRDGTFLEQVDNEVPGPLSATAVAGMRIEDTPVPETAKVRFMEAVGLTLDTGRLQTVEYRLPVDGEWRDREARLVPCGEDTVLGLVRDITDRKRSEAQLRRVNAIQASILHNTAIGIAFVQDRTFEWMNPHLETLFGLTPGMFRGASTRIIYPSEEAYERLGREAYPVLAQGSPSDSELQLQRADGSMFWCRLVGTALEPAQVHQGSIWLLEDITGRKQAEQRLEESLHLFRALLEAIPSPVFFMGADLRCQGCNSAMERFLGLPREQFLGWTSRDLVPVSPDRIHDEADEALLASRGPQVYQAKVQAGQGGERDVIVHKAVFLDLTGEVAGMVGLLLDITEREASARELARIQRLLEAVLEQSPTPILVVDAPERVARICNRAAREFLGILDEPSQLGLTLEAIQGSWRILAQDGAPLPPAENPLIRAIQGVETSGLELRVVRKDGSERICMSHGVPVQDAAGQLVAGMVIFPDLTDQRRAEEALRQARKLESLGLMAGGIAHDFNNLFQMIRGLLEQALAGSHAEAVLSAGRALKVLDRTASLSDRILEYSGKSHRDPEALDLNRLVVEALDLLPGPRSPAEQLSLSLDPELPLAEGDVGQLRRVIAALLVNALEASRGGTPIEVRTFRVSWQELQQETRGVWMATAKSGPLACLSVQDHGEGIPAERLTSIFDPFFSTKGSGRGLGLSASLGILRAHGAGLHVSSTPGQGSCFRVYLSVQAGVRRGKALPAAPPSGRTILLVDDEPVLLEVLGESVRETLGLPVLVARDGLEALEVFRMNADAIGLVLMDATMPRMSGPEAFEAMKRIRPGIQGILCSGFSDQFGEDTVRSCGFQGFLKKPFSLKALQAAVRRVLPP